MVVGHAGLGLIAGSVAGAGPASAETVVFSTQTITFSSGEVVNSIICFNGAPDDSTSVSVTLFARWHGQDQQAVAEKFMPGQLDAAKCSDPADPVARSLLFQPSKTGTWRLTQCVYFGKDLRPAGYLVRCDEAGTVVVTEVGTTVRARPEDYTPDEYARVVAANLTSAFALSQMAFPYLRHLHRGPMINIASLTSFFGTAFSLPRADSKRGIVQLTKNLALAWGGEGITVNYKASGWIETDLTAASRQYVPELEQNVIKRTPLGRWEAPEDIGGVDAFLVSPEASFTNGTVITVDGGDSASP